MKQEDFMSLKDALAYEYERSKDFDWMQYENAYRNVRMDEYLKKMEK